MASIDQPQDVAPRKKSKLPMILGFVFALLLGGGGFFATYSGMLFGPAVEHTEAEAGPIPDIAFVPVDPVIISLPPGSSSQHLRFTAQLEVTKQKIDEVTLLLPRISDVLNSYLRAINVSQMEDPTALVRIRAQMLRRIQIVTGEGRVRDLLITEFVLN